MIYFKKRAFTLLEIVISLAILSLGVLGIFSLIPTGVDQTKRGREQSKAILFAQSKLQEIINVASNDWENFISSTDNHYYKSGLLYKPYYLGPNSDVEKKKWGWVRNTDTTWTKDLGFQWEWHFINTPNINDPLALISLSVSWPQKWSQYDNTSAKEKELHGKFNMQTNPSGDFFKQNKIQYVRLISYVSKGV